MKKLIMLLGAIVLLFSCNKEKGTGSWGFNLDTGIQIKVKDPMGNNLLDPAVPNSFAENQIKIYYLINGQKEEVFDGNLDYPRNFRIYEIEGEYVMHLSPNSVESEEFPVTYIQWNETDTDTIKCYFTRESNSEISSVICRKIWLNGTLVLDNLSIGRKIQIVK